MLSMLSSLYWVFTQVAICAFGGGLSTLPLIEYQLVTATAWLTQEGFAQVLALSQITPGPIAINAATFVGFKQAGLAGSAAATSAMLVTPVLVLSAVLFILKKTPADKSKAFKLMLRPVVAGLLSLSLIAPLKVTWGNGLKAVALYAAGLVLLQNVKLIKEHPPVMLFVFGIIGAFFL